MAVMDVRCPDCQGLNVVKYGVQPNGKQRYLCQDPNCARRIFVVRPATGASNLMDRMPVEMRRIIERALAGGGVEQTARELQLPVTTVAEVFGVLARFTAAPGGLSRGGRGLRRRAAG